MRRRTYRKNAIETYMDDTIEQNWVRTTIGEFGYLLRTISKGEFEFFSTTTIPLIYKNVDSLITNIDKELSKDVMVFEKISRRETAESNLGDLKDILISIKEYYDDGGFDSTSHFDELENYSEAVNISDKQHKSRLIFSSVVMAILAASVYIFLSYKI